MRRGSRLDEIMTLLFMVLAVGATVCFFVLGNYKGSQNPAWFILGGVAIVLRLAQYIMRIF